MSEDGQPDAGPIDYDVLERIGRWLRASQRFSEVQYRPEHAPESVVAEYDLGYFPAAVERAYLRIRWFETDDFSIHYSEQYADRGQWECRWDRHPNPHNARSHVHPPPDAETPGEDASFAEDWRDVLSSVVEELDQRIQSFWE